MVYSKGLITFTKPGIFLNDMFYFNDGGYNVYMKQICVMVYKKKVFTENNQC